VAVTIAVLAGAAVVGLACGGSDDRGERTVAGTVTPPARPDLKRLPASRGCFSGYPGTSQRPCAPVVRGQYDPAGLAISPDGRFVYSVSTYTRTITDRSGKLVNTPGGTIVVFRRDARTGALTQLPGDAGCIKDEDAPRNPVTLRCTQTAQGITGAKTIVLSDDGRFAYVAALNNASIAAFRRNADTGELTQLDGDGACIEQRSARMECPTAAKALHGVRWVTLSPDGRHLYAAAPASDAISAFSVDQATGALRQLDDDAACIEDRLARLNNCRVTGVGLNYPRSITVSPDGRNAYVASDSADGSFPGDPGNGNAVSVFARDPETGRLSQLEGDDACIRDTIAESTTGCKVVGKGLFQAFRVVLSPDGRFAYVGTDSDRGAVSEFERDPDTGALRQLSPPDACIGFTVCHRAGAFQGAETLTMSRDGRSIFAASYATSSVVVLRRSPETGALDVVPRSCVKDPKSRHPCSGTAPGLWGPREIVLSPDGKYAYVASATSGTIAVLQVVHLYDRR
jgi:6-phosphogluconolactonase (cycloisomerase 2 family)